MQYVAIYFTNSINSKNFRSDTAPLRPSKISLNAINSTRANISPPEFRQINPALTMELLSTIIQSPNKKKVKWSLHSASNSHIHNRLTLYHHHSTDKPSANRSCDIHVPAGATCQSPLRTGRINSLIPPMGYVGAPPPGQVLDVFTQMPGNDPHPYENMNDGSLSEGAGESTCMD